MFVFRKIWRALYSCFLRFEIRPFTILSTKGKLDKINELVLKTKADLKEGPDNILQSSLDYVSF